MNKLPRPSAERLADGSWRMPLTKDRWTILDEQDYEWAKRFNWQCGQRGYACRSVNLGNRNIITVYLHRLIMRVNTSQYVDHVSGDTLDNRRINLRITNMVQNAQNRRKHSAQGGTSSQYKGVSWNSVHKKWAAYIGVNGGRKWLGMHHDEEDAARAYDVAALQHYGEYARLNFPIPD